MGAGKTWLLKCLKRTGPMEINYQDLDQAILEGSEYKTILKMMKALGEEHFRRIESELLVRLMQQGNHLIALGGGAMDQGLQDALHKRDDILVVWLDTPFEQCLSYLQRDHKNVRPLARMGREQLRELYQKRRETYCIAQVRLDYYRLQTIKDYSGFIGEVEQQLKNPSGPDEVKQNSDNEK